MDLQRVKALSERILADVLSVGTVVGAGPTVSPDRESDMLRLIEERLRDLMEHHGHETDAELAARFRRTHPDLVPNEPRDSEHGR